MYIEVVQIWKFSRNLRAILPNYRFGPRCRRQRVGMPRSLHYADHVAGMLCDSMTQQRLTSTEYGGCGLLAFLRWTVSFDFPSRFSPQQTYPPKESLAAETLIWNKCNYDITHAVHLKFNQIVCLGVNGMKIAVVSPSNPTGMIWCLIYRADLFSVHWYHTWKDISVSAISGKKISVIMESQNYNIRPLDWDIDLFRISYLYYACYKYPPPFHENDCILIIFAPKIEGNSTLLNSRRLAVCSL